jgi:hypothetical protein
MYVRYVCAYVCAYVGAYVCAYVCALCMCVCMCVCMCGKGHYHRCPLLYYSTSGSWVICGHELSFLGFARVLKELNMFVTDLVGEVCVLARVYVLVMYV